MTMPIDETPPETINLYSYIICPERGDSFVEWSSTDIVGDPVKYIRSDIAEDLLAALETIHSQTNDGLARRVAGDSLAHYRALAD